MLRTSLTQCLKRLVALVTCGLLVCFSGSAQAPSAPPNALSRIIALHLPRLDGAIPVYYSVGLRAMALRDQAEIADCSSWYSRQLGVSVPVTLAVLDQGDWNRVGHLAGYPMAEAFPQEGNVIIMPDSFASFPGQNFAH